MRFKKPLLYLAALVASFLIASALTTVSSQVTTLKAIPRWFVRQHSMA